MDAAILDAFHAVSRLRRGDLFVDDKLLPITALEDAHTPAPGWVGARWAGGTLLVGINPGGGGDEYRRNSTDDELYNRLREFTAAQSESGKASAFECASKTWMSLQRTHNIWRIIQPILDATGERNDEVAFINILPFRTRMDRAAPATVLRRAWERASGRQVAALRPERVIALGKKAWDVLSRFPIPDQTELILFKRGIGDSYIPPESQAVLRKLAEARASSATSPTSK